MIKYDVAIIGSGPAGIIAAIFASKRGKSVILLEKNDNLGRKILATGNGRCNITNKNICISRYHGSNSDFISKVLNSFTEKQIIDFFESLGIFFKEEDNGRLFPRTNQASSVVDALHLELKENNITVKLGSLVKRVDKDNGWTLKLDNDSIILADKLILATGGKAAPQFGSSGDGLFWATKFGHKIIPTYPALVPIETNETWVKDIQGIKLEGTIKLIANGKDIVQKSGDILFTHFGVSGPAVMGISREISPCLKENIPAEIIIDPIPEETLKLLDQKIENIFVLNGAKNVKNTLSGIIPLNLIPLILKNAGIVSDKKAAQISKKERNLIVENIKNIKLTVKRLRPLKEAQVTAGGVDTNEIDPLTMGSKIVPNLYLAGEIMDVDGDSGGFNLQWAWSSGYIAGNNI